MRRIARGSTTSLSSRSRLKANEDGSTTLYLQNESPGKDREANWLPAPEDDFFLMLHLYRPGESVLDGSWTAPPIRRID